MKSKIGVLEGQVQLWAAFRFPPRLLLLLLVRGNPKMPQDKKPRTNGFSKAPGGVQRAAQATPGRGQGRGKATATAPVGAGLGRGGTTRQQDSLDLMLRN